MQLLHGVALLRCIILDILFPSLNTFSKGDGLVGICTTGIIAIYATRINLERQELVASRNIGRSLGELLIELLTTEVFVRIAIGISQRGHVQEVIRSESVVIGRECAASDASLDAFGIVARIFSELVCSFGLGLVIRLELTTIRLKLRTVGKEAFSMIEQQCNGKKVPSGIKKLITPEFIDRGSVAELD